MPAFVKANFDAAYCCGVYTELPAIQPCSSKKIVSTRVAFENCAKVGITSYSAPSISTLRITQSAGDTFSAISCMTLIVGTVTFWLVPPKLFFMLEPQWLWPASGSMEKLVWPAQQ